MRFGKGKRKQACKNRKGDDEDGNYMEIKQEQHSPSTQQVTYEGNQQHQRKLSDNDGDDEGGGSEEHSDGLGSQRSWSPVIKARRRFSASEIQSLEAEYAQDINPPTDKLEVIASDIGTTRRIITTWFQNHRAKGKRAAHANSNATINKTKKIKHAHVVAAPKNIKSKARKNLTQPEIIGSTPGPCLCINQTTADDGYHATSTSSDHAAISGTVSPLDMNDPSPLTFRAYDASYFVPDPTIDMTISPTAPTTTTSTWNHNFYPSLSSSASFITWSQSPSATCHPLTLTNSCHHHDAPLPLVNHPTLPQCCVDELYTGYPCPYHTFYL